MKTNRSNSRALGALLGAALCLGASGASAANHFIAELSGGAATPFGLDAEHDSGLAYGATLGVGGRLPGTAPAWYLVLNLNWADMILYGPPRLGNAVVERSQADLAIGGRGYFPFTPRLRLMTELAFGQVFEAAEVSRRGHDPVRFDVDRFAVFAQTGLQYRLTNYFSIGGRVGLAWMPDPEERDLAAEAAGIEGAEDSQGRWSLGMTTTFHF